MLAGEFEELARKREKEAKKAAKKARKAAKKAKKAIEALGAHGAASSEAGADSVGAVASRAAPALGSAALAGHPEPTGAIVPDDTLLTRLAVATRESRTMLANRLMEHGLYPGQEQILFILAAEGPIPLGVLAERAAVKAPTITKAVTRMESQGFLQRAPSSDDGRSMIVSLTETGEEAAISARADVDSVEKQAFGAMRKSERLALMANLDELILRLRGSG